MTDRVVIGDYELERKLGQGAFGEVYLARGAGGGPTVALKVLKPEFDLSADFKRRFFREIEVARNLRHENIVRVTGSGTTAEGTIYYAMEFCSGGNVQDFMTDRGGTLTVREAATVATDALLGLQHAHQLGIVHRDIKPGNILLSGPGGGLPAKVADFGMAKPFEEAGYSGFTHTGVKGGSPAFMSPEQWTNFKYVHPPSDLWSMGATLYFMISGRFPRANIEDATVVPLRKRTTDVPKEIAEVVDRSLAELPDQRYPSALEMRNALVKALAV